MDALRSRQLTARRPCLKAHYEWSVKGAPEQLGTLMPALLMLCIVAGSDDSRSVSAMLGSSVMEGSRITAGPGVLSSPMCVLIPRLSAE